MGAGEIDPLRAGECKISYHAVLCLRAVWLKLSSLGLVEDALSGVMKRFNASFRRM